MWSDPQNMHLMWAFINVVWSTVLVSAFLRARARAKRAKRAKRAHRARAKRAKRAHNELRFRKIDLWETKRFRKIDLCETKEAMAKAKKYFEQMPPGAWAACRLNDPFCKAACPCPLKVKAACPLKVKAACPCPAPDCDTDMVHTEFSDYGFTPTHLVILLKGRP